MIVVVLALIELSWLMLVLWLRLGLVGQRRLRNRLLLLLLHMRWCLLLGHMRLMVLLLWLGNYHLADVVLQLHGRLMLLIMVRDCLRLRLRWLLLLLLGGNKMWRRRLLLLVILNMRLLLLLRMLVKLLLIVVVVVVAVG